LVRSDPWNCPSGYLTETLCYGQDGAGDEADFEVGIRLHQLADALVVARGQVLNVQLAGLDRVE
jgi:hypothetical protein